MSKPVRKICLVGMANPSANPRLVREADFFASEGIQTTVVAPSFLPQWVAYDGELLRGGWGYQPVDFLSFPRGVIRWQIARARRRLCAFLHRLKPSPALVSRAYAYAVPEVARAAAGTGADLFIAHTHSALPAAAMAARRTGAKYAFDAEDVLAESSAEPVDMIHQIEREYLGGCAYVSTMSEAAADYFKAKITPDQPVLATHNTPSLKDREGLAAPSLRHRDGTLKIYWFGQTLGEFSCAEDMVRALPMVHGRVKFTLRGRPVAAYIARLRELASSLGVLDRLEFLPLISPKEVVRLAGEHDILWGAQPSQELFHQLAIGNKVFAGMAAGLGLFLTDTIAHRRLQDAAPGCGVLLQRGNVQMLADHLNRLQSDPAGLLKMQTLSWEHAERRYNWESEARALRETISRL
jgi:glycosyltransferase involved in cell wall biosynthesis